MQENISAAGSVAAQLSRTLLTLVSAIAILVIALLVYFVLPGFFWPVDQANVPLPTGYASARIELWSAAFDSHYELVVQNKFGEARIVMWETWGPDTQSNLYLTPGNKLAVVGGGQLTVAELGYETPAGLDHVSLDDVDGSSWRYLGVIDYLDDGFRFASPDEVAECINLYGDWGAEFRLAYQSDDAC